MPEEAESLHSVYLNTITTIANCLEAKDVYTRGHSKRVTDYALHLANNLSVPVEFLQRVHLSGMLHDIGKIGIPESILNKPGKLTLEEFSQIRLHPKISIHILSPIISDKQVMDIIRHHHERFDGQGYPDGQKNGAIPLGARILGLADAFDAMTSTRPYRKAMSKEMAVSELERNGGAQFDAGLTKTFVELINSAPSLQYLWHFSDKIIGEGILSIEEAGKIT